MRVMLIKTNLARNLSKKRVSQLTNQNYQQNIFQNICWIWLTMLHSTIHHYVKVYQNIITNNIYYKNNNF